MKKPIRVAVTGAAGNIGYALLFRIASGAVFGPDQPVALNLIEIEPAMKALKGVVMELDDCAFPLLTEVKATCDINEGFKDINWALLVGSVPRKAGMERADLLGINGKIFVGQGEAIARNAAEDVRVLVVGNPCNTNCLIAMHAARKIRDIPTNRWFAMTQLDEARAKAQLAQKAGTSVNKVSNLVIWGNHSPTMYADFYNAKIDGKPVTQAISDHEWLKKEFLPIVGKRGAAIIEARGLSSAASAAHAAIETVRKLVTPTVKGDWFSVGVFSEGDYNVEKGLIYSMPVRTEDGKSWSIVQGLEVNEFSREKLNITQKELMDERDLVKGML